MVLLIDKQMDTFQTLGLARQGEWWLVRALFALLQLKEPAEYESEWIAELGIGFHYWQVSLGHKPIKERQCRSQSVAGA